MVRKKPREQQVAITGVSAFGTEAERQNMVRKEGLLSHQIAEGCVYGIGLSYPPPGVLPRDSSGISALAIAPSGAIFGTTSGEAAHLFWMPKPMLVADLGAIPGVRQTCRQLVVAADGVLYGASADHAGPIFAYDTKTGFVSRSRNWKGRIRTLPPPFRNGAISSLAIDSEGKMLAVMDRCSGKIILIDLATNQRKRLPGVAIDGEAFSQAIGAGPDGAFYVSGQDGQLVRITPDGQMTPLGLHLPCARGKSYLTHATCFVASRSGKLYGGTAEGYLFAYDPAARNLISHGRPSDVPDLHCLAEDVAGNLYAVVGRGRWNAHLARFNPRCGSWADLGMFHCNGHLPWTAYQIAALTSCPDGRIIAGEADAPGHLYAYHPPPLG